MKVVLDRGYGIFELPFGFYDKYNITAEDEALAITRTDERLIKYVEENGVETDYGRLVVVEIPDNCSDWEIDDNNGWERVIYVVDGKLHFVIA